MADLRRFHFVFVGGLVVMAVLAGCGQRQSPIPSSREIALRTVASTTAPHARLTLGINTGDDPGLNLTFRVARGPAEHFLFDTGSAGLWVAYNAMGKGYTRTPYTMTNTYSSGIVYEGTVVYAPVDFGNGLVTGPVPLVRVVRASCTAAISDCPAAVNARNCPGISPSAPHAGVLCIEQGRKLDGTMGADLDVTRVPAKPKPAKLELYNVLFAIKHSWASRFIVAQTDLEIGPRSTSGFSLVKMKHKSAPVPLPNGAMAWKRDVKLCYSIGARVSHYCVDSLFDTGAKDINFQTTASIPANTRRCNAALALRGQTFRLRTKSGKVLASFTTGYLANYNMVRLATPKPNSAPEINTGLTFYNRDAVLFDARSGHLGLRPLSSPGKIGRKGC